MEHKQVNSSNIESVGYDEKTKTLEVKFKGGGIYEYKEVPKEHYDNILNAESVGKYFHINIKGNFDFNKK